MRWLTRLFVDDEEWRAIESDLAELGELRRAREGEQAARRWVRRQRALYPWFLLAERLRSALPTRLTMQHLWRDLRYSVRALARVPVFALTIVVTVGLGLGATAAAIALVRAILIEPLPYRDAASLSWIYTDNPPYRFSLSVADYRALEADHPAFSEVAAYQTQQVTLAEGDVVERVTMRTVTASFFPLLGLQPHVGRVFGPADAAGRDRIAVITHGYWTRRFGASPAVVGRPLAIDGVSHTIIGVLQPSRGPLEHGVAVFAAERWPAPTRKGPFFTTVIGRLGPGASRADAAASLRATNARIFPLWKSSYQDERATWSSVDLKTRIVGDVGAALYLVLAAVACVLLIAAANAVNLLVARGLQRSQELAIRGALGASRLRLLQQVFVETAVLTVASAAAGVGVAIAALRLVSVSGTGYLPRFDELPSALATAAWVAGLALVTGACIGVVPAVQAWRSRMHAGPGAGSRAMTAGRGARQLRRLLVAAEFALATPLLVGAVLVLASLDRLTRVPIGIETGHLLTGSISLPRARYPDDADRAAFWQRAQERLAALPGAAAVALADSRPPSGGNDQNNFNLEDRPTPAGQSQPVCTWVGVSPDFFKTVGLSLVRGRLLDDRSRLEDVIVVDRAWANRFFPGQDVLGRRLRGGGCTTCPWTTVVGVVDNVKWIGLDAAEDGTVYYPFVDASNGFVVLRTAGDPAALAPSMRQAIAGMDAALPVASIATGDELVSEALATPRYLTVLVGLFAGAAFIMAVVGVYGVVSYFVQQQRRDIGIRLALGGDPRRIRRMVAGEAARLATAGAAVGTLAALIAGRSLASILFGVSAYDPRGVVAVPALLVIAAVLACALPARRAGSIDPADVLRES